MAHEGRICLFCAHFWLDFGDDGHSEWTPGYGGEARCNKTHWGLDYEQQGQLAKFMPLGETCPDFELSGEAPESVRRRAERDAILGGET